MSLTIFNTHSTSTGRGLSRNDHPQRQPFGSQDIEVASLATKRKRTYQPALRDRDSKDTPKQPLQSGTRARGQGGG